MLLSCANIPILLAMSELLCILIYTGMDKTSLHTSSRTLFVREGGRMSTSRRTSSYVITYHCSA